LNGQHDNVSEIPSVRCEGASLSCCRQLEGLGRRGYRGLTRTYLKIIGSMRMRTYNRTHAAVER
jgi:hypothetical protein